MIMPQGAWSWSCVPEEMKAIGSCLSLGQVMSPCRSAGPAEDFEIAPAENIGRVVFSGGAFLAASQPGDWRPDGLKAVDSDKVSLREEGGTLRLVLEELRYWFDVEGEIFLVCSSQRLQLGAADGAFLELSGSILAEPGGLRIPAPGRFRFDVEQRLPGLLLRETLLDLVAPGAEDGASAPSLWLDGVAAGAPPLGASPLRVGDGWEFATAQQRDYGNAQAPTLGPELPINLNALTRLYLRLERVRMVPAVQGAAFWRIDSGMLGWTAATVFGLRAAGNKAPQVTLRCAPAGQEGGGWQLAINGRLAAVDQTKGTARLASKLTFWDGLIPVAERQGELSIDRARVPGGVVEIPALFFGQARAWIGRD